MASSQQFTSEDYVRLTLAGIDVDPRVLQSHRPKRNGMLFPIARHSIGSSLQDDNTSLWEFQATGPSLPSFDFHTPAQCIAMRYRLGLPTDDLDTRPSYCQSLNSQGKTQIGSCSHSFVEVDNEDSELAPEIGLEFMVGCEIRHDDSWAELQILLESEAYAVMLALGATEEDSLICRRAGCGDMVKGVKALITHLHIHEIHKETCRDGSETTVPRNLRRKFSIFTPSVAASSLQSRLGPIGLPK